MFHTPPKGAGAGEPEPVGLSERQREQIERALEELIASPPLRTTQQCQQLLRYVVENTLDGAFSLLRERVIGKEVFGRKATYDPGEDPVVRVRAADLRKRLALQYQSLARPPAVRIEIPSGSYRAHFVWVEEGQDDRTETPRGPRTTEAATERESETAEGGAVRQEAAAAGAALVQELGVVEALPARETVERRAPEDGGAGGGRARRRWPMRVLVLVLVCLAVTAGAMWRHRLGDPVRSFWGPLLADSKPVLLSIGSNAVYRLNDARADAYAREMPPGNEGMEFYPKLDPGQTLQSTGLEPTPDSFVALGDVAATSEVVRTLTVLGKSFEERFPNDVSFAEIHEHASVLIGGFNNPMTRELTRSLPFAMTERNRIDDRQRPGTSWVLRASSDSHDTEDYAIVTRLVGTRDALPLLVVAGLGQYGTLAATDFVCRPESLRSLFAAAGAGWRERNLQAVLRIKVTDFKPVSTSIVAVRLW